ncbi:BrnA antitoxin family protein [Aquabacter sp. CN5-332]|uniref:BrnA antitoxin family protein n=1 Tax=Aquabacter sp. CN5-332 TaxID=3156608 RepID=UPI0032B509F2
MSKAKIKEFQPGRGYTKKDWDEVSDSPEFTAEDLKQARPFAEVFPDLAESLRTRGLQKRPTKVPVSIRLSAEVVEHFKAGGPGWQGRIDEALKKVVRGG